MSLNIKERLKGESLKVIRQKGVTLIEIMLSTAIISVLLGLAMPSYKGHRERLDIELVIADMKIIEQSLVRFFVVSGDYPETLAEINIDLVDVWGNPYQYLNVQTAKGNGKKRKDKNLVPINSDFDLYSSGPDGKSVSPLTAKSSRDDIVRASNGAFYGKAEEY